MSRTFTKPSKRAIALLIAVAAMGIAGAAIAYFTSTGSGTGTATVGTSAALTITQTPPAISNLTPGGGSQSVAYSIANPAGNGAQNLGQVTILTVSVAKAANAPAGTCDATDFQVNAPSAAVGTVADGATYISNSNTQPSIQMVNKPTSQDACQGATLTLTLSAARGS